MNGYCARLGLGPMKYPTMSPRMRSVITSPAIIIDLAIA